MAGRGEVGTAAPCQSPAEASESCSPFLVFVNNLEPVGLKSSKERERRTHYIREN